MARKKIYDTSKTKHPLRNECASRKHKGYIIVKSQWNVGGKFRDGECSNCGAKLTQYNQGKLCFPC